MTKHLSAFVDETTPEDAWNSLATDEGAVLVDVRSRPEWSFSGMPDLAELGREVWTVEWQTWPDMTPNLGFLSDLEQQMGDQVPPRMFFMCRAGPRSIAAATATAKQLHARGINVHITNIAEGFEGEKDANGQRGTVTGWKAAGLPWRHS